MGREVRRVPADWSHPRDAAGRPVPLRAADFAQMAAAWDEGQAKWERGFVASHCSLPGVPAWREKDKFVRARNYLEHAGPRPRCDAFMPAWQDCHRTWWQMYETITTGTPLSPPCATAEALAAWLVSNQVSVGAHLMASVQQWLAMIEGPGSCGLFLVENRRVVSPLPEIRKRGFARFW